MSRALSGADGTRPSELPDAGCAAAADGAGEGDPRSGRRILELLLRVGRGGEGRDNGELRVLLGAGGGSGASSGAVAAGLFESRQPTAAVLDGTALLLSASRIFREGHWDHASAWF